MLVDLFLAECAMGMEPYVTRYMSYLKGRGLLSAVGYHDIIVGGFQKYRRAQMWRLRRFQGRYLILIALILVIQLTSLFGALIFDALLFSWLVEAQEHAGFWFLLSCVSSCLVLLFSILFAVLLGGLLASQFRNFRGLGRPLQRLKSYDLADNQLQELGRLCYSWLVEEHDSPFTFKDELRLKCTHNHFS